MARSKQAWDFTGAHVLVTGGSNGIGLATAKAFAAAGAMVTITGRRASVAEYPHDLSQFDYRQLEISDGEAVKALAASLNRLDILVNNAGESSPGGPDQWDPDNFDTSLMINISSLFRLSVSCLPLLKRSELESGACVIGIASLCKPHPAAS